MESGLKAEITEFIKDRLKLPDNAVITRASVTISDDDEIKIIGDTEVKFTSEIPEEAIAGRTEDNPPEPRTKRGRKAKKEAEPKTPPLRRAKEGEGKEITDAQIKGWRATLWARQNGGLLTKEQIAAVNATKGVFASKMTPEQKQQIKDIFDETTPRQF